jgi:hypothetical protein
LLPLLSQDAEGFTDEKDKLKNDSVYTWRCLRLMATKDYAGLIKCSGNLEELINPTKKSQDAEKIGDAKKIDEAGSELMPALETVAKEELETELKPLKRKREKDEEHPGESEKEGKKATKKDAE